MNQTPQKPLPEFDRLSGPFWEAANRDELVIQRCGDCGSFTFYPRYVCNRCMSTSLEWTPVNGRGTIFSFTVTRVSPPAFRSEVPYVLASVELEEGVRILSRIVDAGPEDVEIGQRVTVDFQQVADGIKLPYFRLA